MIQEGRQLLDGPGEGESTERKEREDRNEGRETWKGFQCIYPHAQTSTQTLRQACPDPSVPARQALSSCRPDLSSLHPPLTSSALPRCQAGFFPGCSLTCQADSTHPAPLSPFKHLTSPAMPTREASIDHWPFPLLGCPADPVYWARATLPTLFVQRLAPSGSNTVGVLAADCKQAH